jgi:hypothetical protein
MNGHNSKKKSNLRKREKEMEFQSKVTNPIHENILSKSKDLVRCSKNLAKFHEGRVKEADKSDPESTLGTISSADERDMQILFDGDHVY